MEKLDARKRYTQMILKQSFLKLLREKPVNKITVKELCELSQINRATFYTHYSDCFALLESIENELIDEFEKSLRYVNSFDVTALIEALYDMVDQNQEACRTLVLGNTSSTVIAKMIALAKTDSLAYWHRELPKASVFPFSSIWALKSRPSGFSNSICICCSWVKFSSESFSAVRFHIAMNLRMSSASVRMQRSTTRPLPQEYTAGMTQ